MIQTDDYMSSPVITVAPDTTVLALARVMDEKNIGSLVVVDGEDIAGILTERDVMRKVISEEKDPAAVTAEQIMTRDVKTVSRDATLMEVAALMKQHVMRRLVVVDEGEPVGIITSRDIIDLLVE